MTARAPRHAEQSRRGTLGVLLRACRPRQWSKNVLLVAAPAAAGVLGDGSSDARVAGGIAVFCMLSSAIYLINDVRDREEDRHHPRKRLRPIAARELSVRLALGAAAILTVAGLAIAFAIATDLAIVGVGYLALTISYSLWWRHVILLDLIAVAGGFLLRAVAGGAAAGVPLSRWFLLVTSCCAIFLVAGKRYAELGELGERTGNLRGTLHGYTRDGLRAVLAAAALGAVTAYTIWANARPTDEPWYLITIAPFVLGLARYGVLLGRGEGEAPEDAVLHDRVLVALGLVWSTLFLLAVYSGA